MIINTAQEYFDEAIQEAYPLMISENNKAKARQLEEDLTILPEVEREAYKMLLEELRKK